MGHHGPCSVPGPRVIAVEVADVEQVLENDVKRRNETVYDFVDVVRATSCSHFADPDSVWMDIWVKGMTFWKFSLALAMG